MLTESTLSSGMRIWSAKPETSEPSPAVIFLHERYGPVQHPKDVVERFADNGYVAVLPDLFHRFQGDRTPIEQGEASHDLVDSESLEDLEEVMGWLKEQNYVIDDQIGIMGVCQTGREPVLYAAHHSDDVASIVILNGAIYSREWTSRENHPEPMQDLLAAINCPVLCMMGEIDNLISLDDLARFRCEMEKNRKSYIAKVWRDTPHGWINNTMPGRYREGPAEEAWATLMEFLGSTLGGDWDRSRVIWKFEADTSPTYDFTKHVRWA